MPTREQYLRQLNKAFELYDEEDLNAYEKEVYDTYKGKTPEEVFKEALDENEIYSRRERNIEEYVQELDGSDELITGLVKKINAFTSNNKFANERIESLELENKKLNLKLQENEKKIKENNEKIEELNKGFSELEANKEKLKNEKINEIREKMLKEANEQLLAKKEKINEANKREMAELAFKHDSGIKNALNEINEAVKPYLKNAESLRTQDIINELNKKNEFIISKIEMTQDNIKGFEQKIEILNEEVDSIKDEDEKNTKYSEIVVTKKTIEAYKLSYEESLKEKENLDNFIKGIEEKISKFKELESAKEKDINELSSKLEKEIAKLDKESEVKQDAIESKAGLEIHKIEAKYFIDKDNLSGEIDRVKNEVEGLEKEQKEIPETISKNENQKNIYVKQVKDTTELIDNCKKEANAHAKKLNDEKTKEFSKKSLGRSQYQMIHRGLNIKDPTITAKTVFNGLSIVKHSYMDYYRSHTFIGRWFKFLSFTSAHRDYQKYVEVRNAYTEKSGITKEDIDRYIDNNNVSGSLDKYKNELSEEEMNTALNISETLDYTNEDEKDFAILRDKDNVIAKTDKVYENSRSQVEDAFFEEQMKEVEEFIDDDEIENQISNEKEENQLNNEENKENIL